MEKDDPKNINAFSVYENAPIAICAIDRRAENLPIIFVNNAFMHVLNQVQKSIDKPPFRKRALINMALADIWPNDGINFVCEKIKQHELLQDFAMSVENDSIDHIDDPMHHIVSQRFWVNTTLSYPVTEPGIALLWMNDISQAKQSEEISHQALIAAEKTMDMKSNFLATMSHEIRTPMQSIFGYLELISETTLPDDTKSMVKSAKGSASGLLEILDDILDLAKVDAGKMELDLLETPLRTLTYGVLECMEVKLPKNQVSLKANVAEDVPFVVLSDPTRLRQIMMNLVGNAMKFTDHGEICIHIHTKTQHLTLEPSQCALRFEITDTGIGMSQDVADKLFQAFTQADNSTSRKYGGTGLGLSICEKLIDLMEGQIGVISQEGKGSTFWFEIPTEIVDENNAATFPDLSGLAVLSVEDHPQGAKEIVKSLQHMGAEVTSCPTYGEGMAMAEKRRFDVAIIDQGLPDGLGIDLMKAFNKMQPFMGLIMYTVRDDLGLQHSVKTLGGTYLTKPASRAGLGEAVKDSAKSQAPQVQHDGPLRLLIAEDTLSVQDVLRRQLETLGVEADFVENGRQALDVLAKGEHAILFTDLHMPEVDGYEVVRKIREGEHKNNIQQHAGFPVVVLTADVQLAQKQAYLTHGFNECLLKPVSLGQLRQLLMRWGLLDMVSIEPITPPTATPEKSDKVIIDKDAMIEQLGAFDQMAVDMMHMFVDMTAPQIENLQDMFDEENVKAVTESAHSLKGAARSACCPTLGDLAADLQELSETGKLCTQDDIDQIKSAFDDVCQAVKNLKA